MSTSMMMASENAFASPISASTSPTSSAVPEGKRHEKLNSAPLTPASAATINSTPTSNNNNVASSRSTKDEGKETPMGGPELLALIIEMRLGTSSKSKSGNSNNDPGTMDLSHRKIRNLPNEMVEIIKDDIVRLAVGYNFLTALPTNFVELAKLRYLNIRANLLSSVPAVLCSLPSLEILDMSRNKVRQLPSEPGRLAELRVLSISNNRLRKLPAWLANARHLRILKLEGNPINWPPPHVSVMPPMDKAAVNEGGNGGTEEASKEKGKSQVSRSKLEDKHMMLWISKLKEWIAENEAKSEAQDTVWINPEEEASSTLSPTAMTEVKDTVIIPPSTKEIENIDSAKAVEEKMASERNEEPATSIQEAPTSLPEDLVATPLSSVNTSVQEAPKSLPEDRIATPSSIVNTMPTPTEVTEERLHDTTPPPSTADTKVITPNVVDPDPSTPPLNGNKWNGPGSSRHNEIISATPPASVAGGSGNRWQGQGSTTVAAIESERNSYFKRLSTLPASTISTRVSVPVLLCVDATRGVLYALSQMHTALRQYVAFATDERMTSQLSRVLDIAGKSMASLIQSLDRFDSLSRTKGDTLDPLVIRGVVISCLESIATFRKLIHVVQLQLRSLQRVADIRYTRTLLILLYGSLAEISNSWKTMEPLLDDVAPFLLMGVNSNSSSNHLLQQPALPSIAEATSPITPTSARMTAPPSRPQRRRHAGSFSAQDVVHGASMTSSDPAMSKAIPPLPTGDELKKFQRPPALAALPEPTKLPYTVEQGTLDGEVMSSPIDQVKPTQTVSQQQKSNSRRTLSNASGPKSAVTALYATQPEAEREVPIDDHLLQLVVRITSVAFSVWAGIEEYLISLGLPASASGHSIKFSNGFTSLDIGASGDASIESGKSVMPNTPSRMARSVRQQISEGGASTLPETPDQSTSRSTDPDSTLIDGLPPHSTILSNVIGEEKNNHHHHHHQSSSGFTSLPNSSVPPSPAVQRRLRQLHDLTRGVNEHTHRLHGCLERAQDAIYRRTPTPLSSPPLNPNPVTNVRQHLRTGSTVSSANSLGTPSNPSSTSVRGGGDRQNQTEIDNQQDQRGGNGRQSSLSVDSTMTKTSRELFVESNHFIKSILQISHFIKALSAEGFILPKYVKASMAELTTCARDLTLHLHFLSGPPAHSIGIHSGLAQQNVLSSAPAAISNNTISSQQQEQAQQ